MNSESILIALGAGTLVGFLACYALVVITRRPRHRAPKRRHTLLDDLADDDPSPRGVLGRPRTPRYTHPNMGEHRIIAAALAIIAAASLVGCSSSSGDGRECYAVDDELTAAIAEGANVTPITPVSAAAVESKSFTDAYIVAMSFTVEGVDEQQTGTWAVASLDAPYAPILAVDGFAQEFTDWPGQINGDELDATEDGVDEAAECLADAG